VDHPALVEAADRTVEVMRACGHCGPCNLQGAVEADGRFVAFEWNGRFTGCAPGHALLGTNLVAALLRASVPALAQSGDEGSHDRMVRRTTVFRAMWRHDVATLRTFGRWSRDD
jgi:hypothetical protein